MRDRQTNKANCSIIIIIIIITTLSEKDWVTATDRTHKTFGKVHVVPDMRADRQTDRHTHHNTLHTYERQSNKHTLLSTHDTSNNKQTNLPARI